MVTSVDQVQVLAEQGVHCTTRDGISTAYVILHSFDEWNTYLNYLTTLYHHERRENGESGGLDDRYVGYLTVLYLPYITECDSFIEICEW